MTDFPRSHSHLQTHPPFEQWGDWTEYDSQAWPKRVERHYRLIPTICFNCESACGLLVYVDKGSGRIEKIEGNPLHPGSRGRICAKGPAVLNQLHSPDRILYPLKRSGERGSGKWERTTWDEVLDTFGERIRKAITEKRGNQVMYHVGRPGHDGYMERVLQGWGIDGHNSHTNICSAGARLGYVLWQGADRPSPDHANARCILLIASHLETGHYFNPHAQRIVEAKNNGARLIVIDPRLSNTASMADLWLAPHPGTEVALLLAMANVILDSGRYDASFLEHWVNWEELETGGHTASGTGFTQSLKALREHYARYTVQFASAETGVSAELIVEAAHAVAQAGSQFASHVWRASASGNLGGWQSARALVLLHALTGSVGTPGGLSPNTWNKFVPRPYKVPPPQKSWNELLYPREWPLSHHELSQLLPHFLKEGRGVLDVYFTRVFNPVWTYPDGFSWIEALRDPKMVGLHAALTPVWSETAAYADYVLPMGLSTERHDIQSQETHAGRWLGFRQPVLRVFEEQERGRKVQFTYEANPGEVWEEDEFWIELSWRIDKDGSLGIRQWFESENQPGTPISVDEYYGHIFERSVPGLPEAAKALNMTPLEYMRRHAAFEVSKDTYRLHEVSAEVQSGAPGIEVEGRKQVGFNTPSRKLELYSSTMRDWHWPEQALPEYIPSHVGPQALAAAAGHSPWPEGMPTVDWPSHAAGEVFALVPIYRLPTLIHTRNNAAKWLLEISHKNPLIVSPQDAERLGIGVGDLVKVHTEIGWFINHAWVTEGIKPGVLACSHHLGRWRRNKEELVDRYASSVVNVREEQPGQWSLRIVEGISPWKSADPDTSRVWWTDGGVHQNLTFPVHPDPISGMQCWHQVVKAQKASPTDRYGDVFVDTIRSHAVYQKWKALCRPAPGPHGLRRPLWFARVARPAAEAFLLDPAP